MEHHKKHNIIKEIAVGKDLQRFLPEEEIAQMNKSLYKKLTLLLDDFKKDSQRPQSMSNIDKRFEETHTVFLTGLKTFREQGGNVLNVFCNAVPPEVYYAAANTIPITSCMGASELEEYAPKEMCNACSLGKSLAGFLNSGVCTFQNVANYAINIKACHSFEALSEVDRNIGIEIFNVEKDKEVDNSGLLSFLKNISEEELDGDRFVEYSKLYNNIRQLYREINSLRKLPNPPIKGLDAMWMQQLYLATNPKKLLDSLTAILEDLKKRVEQNIGYNSDKTKKRILLIANRNTAPYSQSYRLIENAGGIVVKEHTCMGVEKGNYDVDLVSKMVTEGGMTEKVIAQTMKSNDPTAMACETDFNEKLLLQEIEEYKIDKVITFALASCLPMEAKQNKLSKFFEERNIAQLRLNVSYHDTYENESNLEQQIKTFLNE